MVRIRNMMLESPLFNKYNDIDLPLEARRLRCLEQIAALYFRYGINLQKDLEDPHRIAQLFHCCGEYDLAISTKLSVTLFLYADTIRSVGTAKHIPLVERVFDMKDVGSISMTEMGHGSNVPNVETTATYDHSTREFIINTPTATSAKWIVGGVGKTSNMTALFARLIVDSVDRGVHVFAIKIRDNETHEPMPGVTIGDCGLKIALNGIDNGFLIFKDYRVPYDTLLDKLSSISPDGKFKSSVKSKEKRLGIIISGIIRGRISVIGGCEIHMRKALTIALRYGALRKQFGKKDSPETSLLDYQIHQSRLLPHLAKLFAIRAGMMYVMELYVPVKAKAEVDPECNELNEYHAILSCLKSLGSIYATSAVQDCRETCGGHGFLACSALGNIRNEQDCHPTWEGDNIILLQQCGKVVLKQVQHTFKGEKIKNPNLLYLDVDFEHLKAYKAHFENRETLLNQKFLIELMEYKVNYVINQSLVALRDNAAIYSDVMDVWNNTQVHYIQEIGKAYGEYIMSKQLWKLVEALAEKCEKTGNVVKNIFYLYVVERIEKQLGIYLEHAFNAAQAKIIRDTELFLCQELRDISIKVIDAITVPDKFLGSVIGEADGQAYAKIVSYVESDPTVYSKPEWLPILKKIKGSKA
eukprot:CAMPEP_0202946804 /NCGR_PEP_ID=MMETSP1395-20130829/10297_1 /ASSEMBLY_ACC=CAM_ASM_000871 /TAXON_ID=5961 /ORGANISM="Blepharisma japonicum, Strain Stock R1072" /LENGTH=639 /DNA_ID=CAMNT_0049647623 /DNA_START=173 /DNA_END=2092 /DNA_ORIENTATION=-